ncbi:MAG: hypothetical protein KatS3mg035_2282 [Bacteroidia bacterium]|nr:MAG: hypothetical protein KatS3mg035_2282 [Bacteroidia bacterium]
MKKQMKQNYELKRYDAYHLFDNVYRVKIGMFVCGFENYQDAEEYLKQNKDKCATPYIYEAELEEGNTVNILSRAYCGYGDDDKGSYSYHGTTFYIGVLEK